MAVRCRKMALTVIDYHSLLGHNRASRAVIDYVRERIYRTGSLVVRHRHGACRTRVTPRLRPSTRPPVVWYLSAL